MNGFKIIKINTDGDGMTGLYKNGILVTYGDYYHNKIDDWIEGYFSALRDNNIQHTVSDETYNEELIIEYFMDYLPSLLVEFYQILEEMKIGNIQQLYCSCCDGDCPHIKINNTFICKYCNEN